MSLSRTLAKGLCIAGLICASALAVQTAAPRTAAAESAEKVNKGVYGYWKHVNEDTGKVQSIFKLYEHKGKLRGRIEKTFATEDKPAQKVCSECEGKLKDRPVQGLMFFWGFNKDEEDPNKWVDGKILNPEDGNIYNAEAELSKDGKTLKVFGYVKLLVKIGGTSEWKRPTAKELEGVI